MSILDGMPSNEAQLKGAVEFANPIIEQALEKMELTERQKSAIELMKEGLSIADIMGMSKQHAMPCWCRASACCKPAMSTRRATL